ncbi:exodeoxyribonuclease VII small subunit [Persicobacter sp. CCB-QB2]|uniref:exodeoxyribonuclease VII small subunit n=1 Tax=Persicobacter sp. CCB-QB2 TaxID=1561025 RepID=UPI0006A9677C|nr:exodeoxyribonuclease VII small subunit [Persicobacter sp. CCB-QB2]
METQSYKSALEELEGIVQKMEQENPEVDELAGMVERAATLLKFCQSKLRGSEEKLNKALEKLNEDPEEG